jgi:hypothetical protein
MLCRPIRLIKPVERVKLGRNPRKVEAKQILSLFPCVSPFSHTWLRTDSMNPFSSEDNIPDVYAIKSVFIQ